MKRLTIALTALIVVLLAVGPLALVWALNVLFGLALPYTIRTWAAAMIVGGLFAASGRNKP